MVSTPGTTRPNIAADVKIIQGGNSSKNLKQMQEFIRSSELRRSQIISITSNETDIEEGDNVLTLFYRKQPFDATAMPLENIQFEQGALNKTWTALLADAKAFAPQGSSVDVISLSRSPKNIGDGRGQTIWYTNEEGAPSTFMEEINRGDGNHEQLAKDVTAWLNAHIAPHQLISVTIHEEMHPNQSHFVNALITHTAGEQPPKLADTPAAGKLPTSGVYSVTVRRGETTEAASTQALLAINERGGQEGHVVTTTNDSINQDIVAVVISWGAIWEAQLLEQMRPAGCCSIF